MSDAAPSPGKKDTIAEQSLGYLRTLDLHDETGQLLTAILVNLRHLGHLGNMGNSASGPRPGDTVRESVRDTVHDTERLVESLFYAIRNYIRAASGGKPVAAVPLPDLVPAIGALANDYSRRTGVEVRMELDPDIDRVPPHHKAVFFRVVQESLTNAFRHSSARVVTIRGSRTGEATSLEIEDDGASHPAPLRRAPDPARPAGGTGLRGMRERVRLAGGECTVEMVKKRGMMVKVVLPYNVT